MASVVEKLYPPVIGSSIPAFYLENGIAKIAVPFSMNRAVGFESVDALQLKIKTVQSNTFLRTLTCEGDDLQNAFASRVAVFNWIALGNEQLPRVGQYLKVQMAYAQRASGSNNLVTGYFSTVATVKFTSKPEVSIADIDLQKPVYKRSYVGVFESGEDKSERPYSYIFNLYDRFQNLIETSEWQLHNSTVNTVASESMAIEKAVDRYTYTTNLEPNTEYFIEYGVRTINNLEVFSPLYICMQIEGIKPEISADLIAENNFDDGYIELGLRAAAGAETQTTGSYIIQRADSKDNFKSWIIINKVNFSAYPTFTSWKYRDFTVEQGIKYQYSIQQYSDEGIYSDKIFSNNKEPTLADFEDMFLFDGKKQIKIRFNPKVSSFKTNLLETKINTIGSKYPFIFRNGQVEYKEFPISGLISYLSDENNLFINYKNDLALESVDLKRKTTPDNQDVDLKVATTQLVDYNVGAERLFKLKLMDWLNDGKIKLFRSPAEGNYFVRLMNISLTPEDRLNRMLHSFSATAYEVEEYSYDNLLSLGFFENNWPVEVLEGYETIKIIDALQGLINGGLKKINRFPIYEFLQISAQPHTRFHLAQDANFGDENLVIISENGNLTISSKNSDTPLPNVFMTYADVRDSGAFEALQEATLTYKYKFSQLVPSEFESIKTISVKNVIETYAGPQVNICQNRQIDNTYIEILKFFVLDFQLKSVTNIEYRNNEYYLEDSDLIINFFDPTVIYHLNDSNYIVENESLQEIDEIDTSITLTIGTSKVINIEEPTVISLPLEQYSGISFGNGVILNCAYQVKTTEFNERT